MSQKNELMNLKIRLADVGDAADIAEVHTASWKTIYRGLIPDRILDNLSVKERTYLWRKYLQSGGRVWIAEDDQTVIGFASVCPSRDLDHNPDQVAEISAIYFLPEYWGRGVGTRLVTRILDEVKSSGFDSLIIWVLQKNDSAIRFYKKLGFFPTGDVKTDHFESISLNVVRYQVDLT